MKYYLYRHIRLDKNEIFYIGVGTKADKNFTKYKTEYSRAFCNHKENNMWLNIVNKTEYKVEILLESDDYKFILNKEKEFIKLYGRKNLKLGTLCNLTNGGEDNSGRIYKPLSDKHKQILSDRMKINNPNKDGRANRNRDYFYNSLRMKTNNLRHTSNFNWNKVVYEYNLNGEFIREWSSFKEAGEYYGGRGSCISNAVKSNISMFKRIWKKEYLGSNIGVYIPKKKGLRVSLYYNNILVKNYNRLSELLKDVSFSKSKARNMLKYNDLYKGYKIKYTNATKTNKTLA